MDAIPLKDPNGVAQAYMCGRCRRVSGGRSYLSAVYSDEQVASLAQASREGAERCCACRECGAYVRREFTDERASWLCDACWDAGAESRAAHRAEMDAKDEAHAKAYEEAIAKARDRLSAEQLHDYMSGLSEEHFCAGWLVGLGGTLWQFVSNGEPTTWGLGEVTEEKIDRLKELSDRAGGWWHWPEGGWGALFVPIDEWPEVPR